LKAASGRSWRTTKFLSCTLPNNRTPSHQGLLSQTLFTSNSKWAGGPGLTIYKWSGGPSLDSETWDVGCWYAERACSLPAMRLGKPPSRLATHTRPFPRPTLHRITLRWRTIGTEKESSEVSLRRSNANPSKTALRPAPSPPSPSNMCLPAPKPAVNYLCNRERGPNSCRFNRFLRRTEQQRRTGVPGLTIHKRSGGQVSILSNEPALAGG
jgi:hypothetical protein